MTAAQKDYGVSAIVALVLTGISYLVGMWAGWITEINWLEVFAVFTSYSCTYLCVKQRRWNYPIGALSTIAYSLLFWQADLLASVVLNAWLTIQLVYGWIRWRADDDARPVSRMTLKSVPAYILSTGLFYLGAWSLVTLCGGSMAGWDTIILVASILAQFLLDNKKIETWIVWAVVNVTAIYVYSKAGLNLVAFQYVFFLLNTIYGYVQWKNNSRPSEDEVDLIAKVLMENA